MISAGGILKQITAVLCILNRQYSCWPTDQDSVDMIVTMFEEEEEERGISESCRVYMIFLNVYKLGKRLWF